MSELEHYLPIEGGRPIKVWELIRWLARHDDGDTVFALADGEGLLVKSGSGISTTSLCFVREEEANAPIVPARTDPQVPIVVGSHGLRGRPQIARPGDLDQPEDDAAHAPSEGIALPGACIRSLSMPTGHVECASDCPGRGRDGSCAADLVRAENAAGRPWRFEVDAEGYWNLT